MSDEPPIPPGRGRVLTLALDGTGGPASVRSVAYQGATAVGAAWSDGQGRARLDLPPGRYDVVMEYLQPDRFTVTVAAGRQRTVRAKRRGRVRTQAIDGSGRPASIRSVVRSGDAVLASAWSDAQGEGRFDLLPGTYHVDLEHLQPDRVRAAVAAGRTRTVRSKPRGRLQVEPLGADGLPASVRSVVHDRSGATVAAAWSRPDGGPHFDLLPGTYVAVLEHVQPDRRRVTVRADRLATARSEPRGRVRASARSAQGAPVDVRIKVMDEDRVVWAAWPGSDGTVDVDLLPRTYWTCFEFAECVEKQVRVEASGTHALDAGPDDAKDYAFVSHLAIDVPGLASADGAYLVPADSRGPSPEDERPAAPFVVRAAMRTRCGRDVPAPDGTPLALRADGDLPKDSPVSTQAALALPGGLSGPEATARTSRGQVHGHVLCGPATWFGAELRAAPAARWRPSGDGIESSPAAELLLTAAAPGGDARATARLRIVPGAPEHLTLEADPAAVGLPAGALVGPGGKPLRRGESLLDVHGMRYRAFSPMGAIEGRFHHPVTLRFGGFATAERLAAGAPGPAPRVKVAGATDESIPAGAVCLALLGVVEDAARNPVPLRHRTHVGGREVLLRFSRLQATLGTTYPFILSAYGTSHAAEWTTTWRAPTDPPLPDNAFLCYVVPGYAPDGHSEADLEVHVPRTTASREPASRWSYRFFVEPKSGKARIAYWLVQGETPSQGYLLAEIAISVIPFVGDGRDLVVYGLKAYHGHKDEALSPFDHAVALLSLAGLLLDLTPALHVNAGVAATKASVKLLRQVDGPAARTLADAIATFVRGLLDRFAKAPDPQAAAEGLTGLRKLGDALHEAASDPAQLERLVSALGIALAAVQLRPILDMLARRGWRHVLDFLEGLIDLDALEAP